VVSLRTTPGLGEVRIFYDPSTRTMQEEFYAVAFRKRLYDNLEQLQQDLDGMDEIL